MSGDLLALGAVGLLAGVGLMQRRSGSRSRAIPYEGMPTSLKVRIRGAVLYEGPSRITGNPIAAVMTYTTQNVKIGNMPQVWILSSEVHPGEARRSGRDRDVCGGCAFAGGQGCYVEWREIGSVWRSYQAGNYSDWQHAAWWFRRNAPRVVRLGAYGDPVAVPREVWDRVCTLQPDLELLGYTGMWKSPLSEGYQDCCMASVKTPRERERAKAAGWRTYRVALPGRADPLPGERRCPATVNDEIICLGCRSCTGGTTGPDYVVTVHGNPVTVGKARRTLQGVLQAQARRRR